MTSMTGIEHPKEYRGRKIEPMMGRSLSEILTGPEAEVYGADEYISGEMLNGKWTRKGDFKAMSVAPPYGSGTWALYNLADDPGETRDLAEQMPGLLKELIAAWDQYGRDVGVVLLEN